MNIYKSFNKFLSSLLIISFLFIDFLILEPNIVIALGVEDSVNVTLNVTAGIAIDSPADVEMSRALSMTNMTAVGTSTWTVTTNNITGYNLTVKASSSPAMQQNATTTISDYATGSPSMWSVSAGTAKFGFSAFGPDTLDATWGATDSCSDAPHVPSNSLRYLGFTTSTSSPVVATRSATTTFAGSATTVCFAVEQKGFFVPSGTYTAIIIATAVTI